MTRPLRLEFAGAFYHVTSRGDRREDIFLNDDDRRVWLEVFGCDLPAVQLGGACVLSDDQSLPSVAGDGGR